MTLCSVQKEAMQRWAGGGCQLLQAIGRTAPGQLQQPAATVQGTTNPAALVVRQGQPRDHISSIACDTSIEVLEGTVDLMQKNGICLVGVGLWQHSCAP
jgi:hypothetical protein